MAVVGVEGTAKFPPPRLEGTRAGESIGMKQARRQYNLVTEERLPWGLSVPLVGSSLSNTT